MFERIRKRDGRIVGFDQSKITSAIAKAGKATGEFEEEVARELSSNVMDLAHSLGPGLVADVEDIQDAVERVLIRSPYYKTAKAYILYREQHAKIRDLLSKANVQLVENYLEEIDWKVRENSNMPYSLQGMNNYISSEITAEYWLNRIYPTEIREAHREGDLHLHDLGLLAVYCVGWDLKALLLDGFKGVEGKVESAPAKHLRSALGQIVNFFYTLQGEAAGAQAFSHFDTLLAPFVRADDLDYVQVRQAFQEFVFNTNIPTRVGFRTPFTNVTLDLQVPKDLAVEQVIIGGLRQKDTYSDFQQEMDLVNRAFAEVMLEGDARGRAFTFPIPTYQITPDFNWENPDLDSIWRMTGRYGIPYFSNFVNSDMTAEDVTSMCCRLRLDKRELLKRGGGLFGAHPLTGSVGVVTINLPRIGYLAGNEKAFLERLKKMLSLAKESLSIKRKVLERFTGRGFYPYSRFYLRDVKEARGSYWCQHFSTIGIVGMNEACLNLLGENVASEKGRNFSLRLMDFIRDFLSEAQEETGDMFNLEATPAESTSYRLAMLDKARYPQIICANEEAYQQAAPFYTNSTQLPVNFTDDIFETLELQDELQTKYTGGTALHIYLGEQVTDTKAVKGLIRKVVSRYHIPYFTITPTFSVCRTHGYLSGEQTRCPSCDQETEVYSRVVGYLSPVRQWNIGKQAEYKKRKTYKIG
ncbi:MAG: ribonucleoside triphosphate reductase [Deltaproteobacteria bacterium HGW-Deltaproteobacteria-15]|nr:MAG: ribonucleoside triphosphate reductase [Deltaproteobacteria bacterium HGW-Deltaproteobacteria-15]